MVSFSLIFAAFVVETSHINLTDCCRCKCSRCSMELITKPEECRCCREIERCNEKLQLLQDDIERSCITEHGGFVSVCLNRWVLEVAGFSLKTKNGRRYSTLLAQGRTSQDE